MARTADPNRYLDDFQDEILQSLKRYQRLETVLASSNESDSIKKGVAEDAAFRLGVLWETFQGDWHLAAISRDPRAFVGTMQGELNSKVSDIWARSVIEAVSPDALTVPKRPTMAQVMKMLDPQGFNVTFADMKSWKKSADKHLAGNYQARVNSVVTDLEAASLLHLVKKTRNFLAHGSDGSKEEFNKASRVRGAGERIGLTGTANEFLQREGANKVSDAGKYLRAKQTPNGPRRIESLHTRISEVAEMLRVATP